MLKTISSALAPLNISETTMGWEVRAEHQVQYKIIVQKDLFDVANVLLADYYRESKRLFLIIDENVYQRYRAIIINYLYHHNIQVDLLVLTAGEENKTMQMYQQIIDKVMEFKPHRRQEPLLAIGGGVITDAVSFAAATYKRGIPVIRIPTTLMGMIDAAIGVKCAVNYNHKNLLGAYHGFCETLIDPVFLRTISSEHIRNGIAEIIKMAIVCSRHLFQLCENHIMRFFDKLDHPDINSIISLAIELMLKELASNLYEYDLQRVVDFGHTWSPEIELSSQPLLHGYAVNVDMAYSVCIANVMGFVSADELERIFALMKYVNLPLSHPLMKDKLFIRNTLTSIIKHRGGKLNLPLPNSIGACIFLQHCDDEILDRAHKLYCSLIN